MGQLRLQEALKGLTSLSNSLCLVRSLCSESWYVAWFLSPKFLNMVTSWFSTMQKHVPPNPQHETYKLSTLYSCRHFVLASVPAWLTYTLDYGKLLSFVVMQTNQVKSFYM